MSRTALCDGCGFLQIERPVNMYDVWRACCCDPDKPLPGARRVVGVAPAGSRRGPTGIRTPVWCRGRRNAGEDQKENRRGADDTVTVE